MGVRFPFLGDGRFLAFSHRGAAHVHPENTIEAFQAAFDLGYTHIETDVHASSEGELFAFHDEDLGRVTGVDARLGELSCAEIDAIRFDGGYRIPRLAELFITWPRAFINIDPKGDSAVEPLVRSIRSHDAVDRVCVGSFSDRRISHCRSQLGPALCTSAGPIETARLVLASRGIATGSFDAAALQVPETVKILGRDLAVVTDPVIEAARDRDIAVHVWTIDDSATMASLIERGVSGIMTDEPETLRSVARAHGIWQGN